MPNRISISGGTSSGGGTGTVTGTGTSGQLAYWDGTSSITGSTTGLFDGTNMRVGVTGAVASTNERVSFRYTSLVGNAAQSNAALAVQYLNAQDVAFTSFQRGLLALLNRTITTNVTDTNDTAVINTGMTITAGTAIYTHSGTVAQILCNAPSIASGTAAMAYYSAIRVEASAAVTGARKVAIHVGAQTSGTTGNARWSDSTTFPAGNWNFSSSSTDPSHHAGAYYIGGTAAHSFNLEKLSVQVTATGDAFSHVGGAFLQIANGNTAFTTTGDLAGVVGSLHRTTTGSVTDTVGRMSAVFARMIWTIGGTYTNATTNGVNYFSTSGFPATGGTLAVTHFSGYNMSANSQVTGTNKYGVRIQSLTGANTVNAAYWADDVSGATTNYFLRGGSGRASFGDFIEFRQNADPGAVDTDTVRLGAKDTAGAARVFAFRDEVGATAEVNTSSQYWSIWLNNTQYKVLLA